MYDEDRNNVFLRGIRRSEIETGMDIMPICQQKKEIELLHQGIAERVEDLDSLLWRAFLEYQGEVFYTSSGLPFSYTVKRKKNGEYSGELLVSRKESSKTLTKSSVFLAFHRVTERIWIPDAGGKLVFPEYKGPKAIGQIFGISYIYSIFWNFGLIRVPEKVADRLRGSCLR